MSEIRRKLLMLEMGSEWLVDILFNSSNPKDKSNGQSVILLNGGYYDPTYNCLVKPIGDSTGIGVAKLLLNNHPLRAFANLNNYNLKPNLEFNFRTWSFDNKTRNLILLTFTGQVSSWNCNLGSVGSYIDSYLTPDTTFPYDYTLTFKYNTRGRKHTVTKNGNLIWEYNESSWGDGSFYSKFMNFAKSYDLLILPSMNYVHTGLKFYLLNLNIKTY